MSSRQTPPVPARAAAVADRLHSAAIHLLRLVRQVDVAAGLGPAQLSALSVLVFGGPKSLGALAAAEQVKPPSMTRVVQELQAAGYVKRRPDASDRRAIRLEATAKGIRLLQEGRSRRTTLLASWLEELDSGKLAAITRALPVMEHVLQTANTETRRHGGTAKGFSKT
jgi:DNA-binding MarR family transcriptional regulator